MTHDVVMESVHDNEPASVPASPPTRNSMEDADSSLTRKRPRLDDGTEATRRMSVEPNTPAGQQPSHHVSDPVEVTINVRSQPPSSQPSSASGANDSTLEPRNRAGIPAMQNPTDAQDQAAEVEGNLPADSPPVVAIELSSDDEDGMVDYMSQVVQLDGEDDLVEAFFDDFPYAGKFQDHVKAAQVITNHFTGTTPVEAPILPAITAWFERLPDHPSRWRTYYTEQAVFWDEIGTLAHKIVQRRHPLGDDFANQGLTEDAIIFQFFRSYIRIVLRLVQIDTEMLSSFANEVPPDQHLLSTKHLKTLDIILRVDKGPIFHLLAREHHSIVGSMSIDFVRAIFKAPGDGAEHLVRFGELAWDKLPAAPRTTIILVLERILEYLGCATADDHQASSYMDRPKFCQHLLQLFRKLDADLQVPGKVADVNATKDLLLYYGLLLTGLVLWDSDIAEELGNDHLGFGDRDPSTTPEGTDERPVDGDYVRQYGNDLPSLIMHAWKFKLLKKYILKGKMELRVMSIGTMDLALVDLWRDYNGGPSGTKHPVMQYFADFLLHEKLVDYIIGVDSHPQLIQRSGNIVGFLVVTNRYSTVQTDSIWNTVANSPDPRVVSATIVMLRGIVNLMKAPALLYLTTKLYELPIETYTLDIIRFSKEVSIRIPQEVVDWASVDRKAKPVNLFVRLIQDTAPSRSSTKITYQLFSEAAQYLQELAPSVIIPDREQVFEACLEQIRNKTNKATGSARAIHILCYGPLLDANTALIERLDLTRHLAQELCHFVTAEHGKERHPSVAAALEYRLDPLAFNIIYNPNSLPIELYENLWDHLVGKDALNELRDRAWARFTEAAKHKRQTEFVARTLSEYIPRLDPRYYSRGLFEFVNQATLPLVKRLIPAENGSKEVLEVPGARALWQLTLTAPAGSIEELSASCLATRYLDIYRAKGVTFSEVEDAHIALAEQCTKNLLSSYRALREATDVPMSNTQDVVSTEPAEDNRRIHELRVTRTLLFVHVFLHNIRPRPEFLHIRRSDSKCEPFELEDIRGDPVDIRFQVFGGTSSDRQTMIIGRENKVQDLYDRLQRLSGFSKLQFIAGGQTLDLEACSQKLIGDVPTINWLLVRNIGHDPPQPSPGLSPNDSAFETSIINHFEDLFSCMDSDDSISEAMFKFLCSFPPRERIIETVASGTPMADEIFPPGKVYQAHYAALALQYRLRSQLNKGIVDETFLSNAIRLLVEALLNPALIAPSLSRKHDVPLAADLVGVLLDFLRERPLQDVSAKYFSNETLLVDRLLALLSKTLAGRSEDGNDAWKCFGTILEASLHSRKVWEEFIGKEDLVKLHECLLLSDPRRFLRHSVSQTIAGVCGSSPPSTSPIMEGEMNAAYWNIISSILPEAVRYPEQAQELFSIAEQVFRRNDETAREENSLRAFLTSWSSLLLNYKHEEFVGRDDVDVIILGFTKLLLYCVRSLKSFKKPLNVGDLMSTLFHKFLFPPTVAIERNPHVEPQLPVLESSTRQELYELTLALVEDRGSYDMLLNCAEGLVQEEEGISIKSGAIDRANEIRSSPGYVGLFNPRAICYSNSLITQLFMNFNFRKFMLEAKVADARASQRLLFETQKLFANMQNSYRKAADPRDFAACVKGLDGQPIDINIQMDADEFYNLLFDQWEGQMLSQERKQLFRSFYGGHTVNQIKSKECEHVSERVESYFVIQCDVQGKTNLQESLQSFVEGDVMEGDNKYKCESCGGRFVDAVKRTCLKDVPDNLIFHLKRFDFDLVEMRRTKINDHFEFPSAIDVSLYHVDHLSDPEKPRKEDLFELVGVLVHQGTSENGHYYSFIRQRPSPSGSSDTWLEFNDRDVSGFDPSQIATHAFGGFYDDPQFQRTQKQYSAYMLFYQRKSSIEADQRKYASSPTRGPPKVTLPTVLDVMAAQDNQQFIREYSLWDTNHSRFIRQTLSLLRTVNGGICSEDHRQETQAISLALEHINQVLSRVRDVPYFDEMMSQLKRTIQSCSNCCRIAIEWMCHQDYRLANMLLRCPHQKVRAQTRNFLMDCLRQLKEKDPASYSVDVSDSDSENTVVSAEQGGVLERVVTQLRMVAEHTSLGTRGWDDFYLTLCQLCQMGDLEVAAMLTSDFLWFCLDVLCMHADSGSRERHIDLWRLVERKKYIYNRMVELVYIFLSKIDVNMTPVVAGVNRWETFDRPTQKFPLNYPEKYLLLLWHEENKAYAALDRMIENFDIAKSEVFYPGEILKNLLASRDLRLLRGLRGTVADGIAGLTLPFSEPYIRSAVQYCEAVRSAEDAQDIIQLVTDSAKSSREQGGEAHLYFFRNLLTVQNEAILSQHHPDWFYDQSMWAARRWGSTLLLYDDDAIRKSAQAFIQHLFVTAKSDDVLSEHSLRIKYDIVRGLAKEMTKKIRTEYEIGTMRGYVEPLIRTCLEIIQLINNLIQSEDPRLEPYKRPDDLSLIQGWQMDVELKLRTWALEDDTILSGGDAYDNSEYATDSDEVPDIES